MTTDPHDLARFVSAQSVGVYEQALAEVRAGAKRSHWMWFVFPQIAGLGQSPTARHYAIRSLDEARAYFTHPLLGERLREIVAAATKVPIKSAEAIFGGIDAVKLRSSLTLFAEAAGEGAAPFRAGLQRFFGGEADAATIRLIGSPRATPDQGGSAA